MVAEKIKYALENMHRMTTEELAEYDAFLETHAAKPLADYSPADKTAMVESMPILLAMLQARVKELRATVERLEEKPG